MTEPVPVRRIEVFTRAGQPRIWSAEDKARNGTASYSELESVCATAAPIIAALERWLSFKLEPVSKKSKLVEAFATGSCAARG